VRAVEEGLDEVGVVEKLGNVDVEHLRRRRVLHWRWSAAVGRCGGVFRPAWCGCAWGFSEVEMGKGRMERVGPVYVTL
jgi:hypothetical protein